MGKPREKTEAEKKNGAGKDGERTEQMGLKERFCRKLYEEMQEYRNETMKNGRKGTFDQGKTQVLMNLYEILLQSADLISDMLLMNLTNQSTGILESLYDGLASSNNEDMDYDDMRALIENGFDEESEDYRWWDSTGYEGGMM